MLAPVCAEYLAAYGESTGDPMDLLLGLLFLSPLYGGAALLVREAARRTRRGWAAIGFMAAGFGVVQAGVVDQSLFSTSYLAIAEWDDWRRGTVVAPLGVSGYFVQLFVLGHVLYSIGAPIALIEACRPATRLEPWLGRRGLALTAAVYAGMSVVILAQHQTAETSHASPGQVVGALVVAAAFVGAAFWRRPAAAASARKAPHPLWLGVGGWMLATTLTAVPETWPGVGVAIGAAAMAAAALSWLSRASGWRLRHVVAVAGGVLLGRALLAFTYRPVMGDVSDVRKYLHNVFFLLLVTAIWRLAARRARDDDRPAAAERPGLTSTSPGGTGRSGRRRWRPSPPA